MALVITSVTELPAIRPTASRRVRRGPARRLVLIPYRWCGRFAPASRRRCYRPSSARRPRRPYPPRVDLHAPTDAAVKRSRLFPTGSINDPARVHADGVLALVRLGRPVCNQQDTAPRGGGQHIVRQLIGLPGVETCGRLIEEEYRTTGEERPGHGEPSPLAPGDGDAVLTDWCLQAGREGGHPGAELGRVEDGCDLGVAGVGSSQGDVGPQGASEHLRPLVDQCAGRPYVGLGQLVTRDVAQPEGAALQGPEAQQRVDQTGLARSARTGDGQSLAGRDAPTHPLDARANDRSGTPSGSERTATGSLTGIGTASRARSRRAAARTARARDAARVMPGTGSNVPRAARGRTATITGLRWWLCTADTATARTAVSAAPRQSWVVKEARAAALFRRRANASASRLISSTRSSAAASPPKASSSGAPGMMSTTR